MKRSLIIAVLLGGLCVSVTAAEPRVDLSEPRMSVFLFNVALEKGDLRTVREIYVGKDQSFSRWLDAVDRFLVASRRFAEEMERKYGASATPMMLRTIQVGQNGSLFSPGMVSRFELKETGDMAELLHGGVLSMRLRRVDARWHINEIHVLGVEMLIPFVEAAANAIDRVRQDVTADKFRRPYEAVAALADAMSSTIRSDATRDDLEANPNSREQGRK